MTAANVTNILQDLNAAGVDSLKIEKDGTHVLVTIVFNDAAGAKLPHFHVRALPANVASLVATAVNNAPSSAQPMTTDGT